MDRGAWWATVHGVTGSTQLKQLSMHTHTYIKYKTNANLLHSTGNSTQHTAVASMEKEPTKEVKEWMMHILT